MKKINNIDSQLKVLFKTIIDPKIKDFNKLEFGKSKNWDSLKHMDLITSMEDELKIKFSMDEIVIMKDIKTIKKIINKKNK